MVVPIFSFGDNPIWFKLLIVSICLYFLGRSMRNERLHKLGSFDRPNMAKMTLRIFAFLLWPAFDGRFSY